MKPKSAALVPLCAASQQCPKVGKGALGNVWYRMQLVSSSLNKNTQLGLSNETSLKA